MATARPSMLSVPLTRARGISTSHDIFSHPSRPTGIASAAYHGSAAGSYARSHARRPSRLAPAMWYRPSASTRMVLGAAPATPAAPASAAATPAPPSTPAAPVPAASAQPAAAPAVPDAPTTTAAPGSML